MNSKYLKRYQTKEDNCFSTCVANILFLSNEELKVLPQHTEENWAPAYQEYLKRYNYQMLFVDNGKINYIPDTLCIITGGSPYTKDSNHSVIGKDGEVEFDPKEKGWGLKSDIENWEYCFLIPIVYPESKKGIELNAN